MHYQNYTYRTGSYRKQHKRYTANRKRQEEYESLPSFLFFRLRLLICIMLFLAFVTADKYVLTKEDTAPVFQKIEIKCHTLLTLIVSYIEERNFAGKARDMVIEIRYILL